MEEGMIPLLNRRHFLSSLGIALTGSLDKAFGLQGTRSVSPPQGPQSGNTVTFTIDARHIVGDFPHYWESIVGSGHANLALRADYLDDLKKVRQNTGMQSVRFHGIFDDDNGVCRLDQRG